MFFPLLIKHLQKQILFCHPHDIRPKPDGFFGHMTIGSVNQPGFDFRFGNAIFGKPIGNRCLDPQDAAGIGIKRF